MSKPSFTPGPWAVESAPMSDTLVSNPVAYFIQGHFVETIAKEQRLANERLIAAAPEMLEALQLCHEVLWNGYKPDSEAATKARTAALRAIEKAEGRGE